MWGHNKSSVLLLDEGLTWKGTVVNSLVVIREIYLLIKWVML